MKGAENSHHWGLPVICGYIVGAAVCCRGEVWADTHTHTHTRMQAPQLTQTQPHLEVQGCLRRDKGVHGGGVLALRGVVQGGLTTDIL